MDAVRTLVCLVIAMMASGCDEENQFAKALRENNTAAIADALVAHPEVLNATNKHGETLLLRAVSPEMIALLAAKGADVNARTPDGTTALHYAAGRGQAETVRLLLQKGARAGAKNQAGETPLHQAAWNAGVGGEFGAPPYQGKDEIIALLVAAGADANARTADGMTPLHLAASGGGDREVQALLDHGADPKAGDASGQTPLHLVAKEGDNRFAGEKIRCLLKHGADAEARAKNGWTPLHEAADHGNLAALAALLKGGADPNARDTGGWTPLHRGILQAGSVRLLLENGADAQATTDYGYTAWALATKPHLAEDRPEIMAILREHGGEPKPAPPASH